MARVRMHPLFTSIEAAAMNANSDGIRILRHRMVESFTADETSAGYSDIPADIKVRNIHNNRSFSLDMFLHFIGVTSKTSICRRQA
ncbi:hypothetical protein [Ruminococcus albus]|uniref:hypothetical protein n=1 Tax=Ruminococcus albus TaxID=1264 RepID=UPI001FA85A86|nr:hypothetical protein [Ruminococcus albus]